jgi:hypothetical protein
VRLIDATQSVETVSAKIWEVVAGVGGSAVT